MFIVFKPYLKHSYGLMNILKNETLQKLKITGTKIRDFERFLRDFQVLNKKK